MYNEVFILVILILISAFFSGTEIAYVVSNKLKIEIKSRKNKIVEKSALFFVRHPQDFFSTILIGNNIVNIAFASISTIFLTIIFHFNEISILIVSSFLLLIIGEIVPKYFSRELADRLFLISAVPVKLFYYVFYPFVKSISYISSVIVKSEELADENINFLFNREDIEHLVEESRDAGLVKKSESNIISKALDLSKQKVYEAMRPRTDIVGVEIAQTIDEALNIFVDSGYSKLPVYEENLDNIRGVIYAHDIFKYPNDIKSILKEVIFVPETKKSLDMLNEFLTNRISIAIVIDEFGGTAGILTTEDLIEELFGEIEDEYDVEEDICRKIAPNTFIISGKVEIDYVNEKFDLKIPSGDYETISGFITYNLGKIPLKGEKFKVNNFDISVLSASKTTVELIKLVIQQDSIRSL
jgi:CBS domain containing-hemolysin-like protein